MTIIIIIVIIAVVVVIVTIIIGLRVPPRRIRDFALFSVCSSCKNGPSARCASAANVVCRDDHVSGSRNILLRHILQDS
jgi:hypothetical protein